MYVHIPNQTTAEWDAALVALPDPHLLQTIEWAQVKSHLGWKPFYLVWFEQQGRITLHINQLPSGLRINAAALVLQRSLYLHRFATPMNILYAPKGPLLNWNDAALRARVITDLQTFATQQGAIFLKIDPDICFNSGPPGESNEVSAGQAIQIYLQANNWKFSSDQIQFRNTVFIDLTVSEAELLDRMKQKTRYNIRLASRKGVTVRLGTNLDYPLLYRLYAETAIRDGFIIRDEAYYHHVWSTFAQQVDPDPSRPVAYPLIAEVAGEPVAALVLFIFANKAWYLYGMSRELHRDKMPNYLLQWEAMRLSKAAGCRIYDLWGAPDELDTSDPMWGVYRFKEGLGGNMVRHLGAWDYPARPILYRLFSETLPRLLAVMRRHGQAKTRRIVG
jgi:peptidoglycan pentaglycine glycine transferase (the first glycine)